MTPRWISIREAAELVSMSSSGLRKLISRDIVPVARLGRTIRIDRVRLLEQLEAQLEGRTTTSKTRSAHG
jgi:excisionase family DNA binding protein